MRDALTGRLLTAENTTESSAERMKQILAPVLALDIRVLGTISDAQKAEINALVELWPDVPHQTCHFHALRDAGELAMAQDRQTKKEIRKQLQPHVRNLRKEIKGQMEQASETEQEQTGYSRYVCPWNASCAEPRWGCSHRRELKAALAVK